MLADFFFGKSIGFAKWMTKLTIRCKSLTCHDVKVFQLQKKHIALLQKRFHRLAQSQVHVRIYVISTVYKFLFSAFFSVPSFDISFFISIFNHAYFSTFFSCYVNQSIIIHHYLSILSLSEIVQGQPCYLPLLACWWAFFTLFSLYFHIQNNKQLCIVMHLASLTPFLIYSKHNILPRWVRYTLSIELHIEHVTHLHILVFVKKIHQSKTVEWKLS